MASINNNFSVYMRKNTKNILYPRSVSLNTISPSTGSTIVLDAEQIELGETVRVDGDAFNVGRYIHMNMEHDFDGDTGLVLNTNNLQDFVVSSSTTTSLTVDVASGLSAGDLVKANGRIHEVLSHSSNIITIETSPTHDWCSGSILDSPVAAHKVNVSILVVDNANAPDVLTIAHGSNENLQANAVLYDTKASGTLGSVILTDEEDHINIPTTAAGTVSLTFEKPLPLDIVPRSVTVPLTPILGPDDEFTLCNQSQALESKTITDDSNNVTARALFFGSGANTVSTYASIAPTANQFLKATSGTTAAFANVVLAAGANITLNGAKSNADAGAGTITIAYSTNAADEEKDPSEVEQAMEDIPAADNPNFPGVSSPGTGIPGFPGIPGIPLPIPVVAAVAGAAVAGAVAAGFVAAGVVATNTIEPTTTAPNDPLVVEHDSVEIMGDVVVHGNALFNGTTTFLSSENLSTHDRYININSNYPSASPVSTGIIGNLRRFGGVSGSQIDSFTAAVAGVSDAVMTTFDAITGVVANAYISIWTDSEVANDIVGLYEVLSVSGAGTYTITLKGGLTPTSEPWSSSGVATIVPDFLTHDFRFAVTYVKGIEFDSTSTASAELVFNNSTTTTRETIATEANALTMTNKVMDSTNTYQDVIPVANNTYDLGSPTVRFQDAHLQRLRVANADASALTAPTQTLLYGTASSQVNGPHLSSYSSSDVYPLTQQLNYTHNDIYHAFDAYFEPSTWKSSTTAGGNFAIHKNSTGLQFKYANVNTQGSSLTWTNGAALSATGVLSTRELNPFATGTYDIGAVNLRYKDGYMNGLRLCSADPSTLINPTRSITYGTVNSTAGGPHHSAYVSSDLYPVKVDLSYSHDNCATFYDTYYDGSTARSSHNSKGYRIFKFGGKLLFDSSPAAVAGSAVSFTTRASLNETGFDSIHMSTAGYLQFNDAAASNYCRVVGPGSPATNVTYTIPYTTDTSPTFTLSSYFTGTQNSSFAIVHSFTAEGYKYGAMVQLKLTDNTASSNIVSNANITISSIIPAGYRPTTSFRTQGCLTYGGNPIQVSISVESTGTIVLTRLAYDGSATILEYPFALGTSFVGGVNHLSYIV